MPEFTLILVRHAEAASLADSDHSRELTSNGRAQAENLGKNLSKRIDHCDLAVMSSAMRAIQTFDVLTRAYDVRAQSVDPNLYSANSEFEFTGILKLRAPKQGNIMLIVGHNPVISAAATVYSGERLQFAPAEFLILKQIAESWDVALESDGCWEIARPSL